MPNHKLIGFILNIEGNELKKTQIEICQISKKFQKDDVFYVSGAWDIISKNEISSYVLNYRNSEKLTEELETIKSISKNTDPKFNQTFFYITNQTTNNVNRRKLKSLNKMAEIIECSSENFIKKFEEYNDKNN